MDKWGKYWNECQEAYWLSCIARVVSLSVCVSQWVWQYTGWSGDSVCDDVWRGCLGSTQSWAFCPLAYQYVRTSLRSHFRVHWDKRWWCFYGPTLVTASNQRHIMQLSTRYHGIMVTSRNLSLGLRPQDRFVYYHNFLTPSWQLLHDVEFSKHHRVKLMFLMGDINSDESTCKRKL